MGSRWFSNFGAGRAAVLHGSEAVISPEQHLPMASSAGTIRLTPTLKRAIDAAVRRALKRRRRGDGDV